MVGATISYELQPDVCREAQADRVSLHAASTLPTLRIAPDRVQR